MEIYLIAGLSLLLLGLLIYVIAILRSQRQDNSILLLQQQMDALRQQLGDSMSTTAQRLDRIITDVTSQVNQQMANITQQLQITTGQIGERLDTASRTIADVKQNLGAVQEANKRIFEIARDIASLQDLLKPAKLRGGVGEMLLENLLEEFLPGRYSSQYKFRDGTTVDFAIRLKDCLLTVDSKFPLESFHRLMEAKSDEERKKSRKEFLSTIKKHIDTISQKYIKPNEGTVNFALMYIPAENVYYETIIREDEDTEGLFEYCKKKMVVPVSPNTFLAYLMTIIMGFKGMEIEKNARLVLDELSRIRVELDSFTKDFSTLGGHLKNAINKYEELTRGLSKIENRMLGLTKVGQLPSGEK